MTEPSETPVVATGAVRQRKPTRRRRIVAAVICASALLWCGAAIQQRFTRAWHWANNVRGFVAYGCHVAEFSPDATKVAIAFGDKCKVLDLASGTELSRLDGYDKRGISSFSSDGKIISDFSNGKNGGRQAYLWNASDGRILGRLDAPENVNVEQSDLFFSPDNKKIVGVCADWLIVWDSSDLKCLGQVKITQNPDPWFGFFQSWNPVTHELTGVDTNGNLLTIDIHQETAKPLFPKQERTVKTAKWSPDGTRLVTIDRENGSVSVWDAQVGRVVANIPEKEVLFARFSPDGKQIVTEARRTDVVRTGRWAPPAWDRRTRIWDAKSGKLTRELPTTGIVTFSPDWSFWVETGPEGLWITRSDGSESCHFSKWFDGHGCSCVFARDSSYLASVNGSGRVAIWRHHDPTRFWMECVTGYEFWMSILALLGLTWAVSGLRTKRHAGCTCAGGLAVERILTRNNHPLD